MKSNAFLLLTLLLAVTAHAKQGRIYYTAEKIAAARSKIAKFTWAKSQAESLLPACQWLVKMSDQQLWDFVPPPEQIRAINVCIAHDCPICGDEITRKAGHYPWILSRDRPFKVKCPVCNNEFPKNDFQPWNTGGLKGKPESGPGYEDKGLGWLGPDGRRYYFVPYYIYWQRWARDILGGIRDLSTAYLLTGEAAYAHKCAVLLVKIAEEYERFDYANQAYHEGLSGIRGRISDYIWSTGDDSRITLAYDAIYPAFDQDPELRDFLKGKDIENPTYTIENKMLNLMTKDVMSGFVAGNMGMHQETLCYLAIVLGNDDPAKGPTTKEMRDWIMSGGGRVEDLLWNGFWREGLGSESSPGYASGWCVYFYELANLLPRLGVEIWANPKLKKMADVGLDLTVAGRFCPDIGDSGGPKGSGMVAVSPSLQGPAFTHYKDPRYAKALAMMEATSKNLWEDLFDEGEVARVVAKEGKDLVQTTRNLGGYGLAILESGRGENRRGVTMYYGDASGGHGHYDRLNVEMFAYGRPVLPDDGYPYPFTRPSFCEWRRANTHKHYCVMVDEQPQKSLHAGHLNTLAASPQVQLMDASAEIAYEGAASLYRRTSALVDLTDQNSYLLDIFRVRGGMQHDWCFHGPPFPEFTLAGGQPGPVQTKGTLAGEDVPYGTRPPGIMTRLGVTADLLRAEGLLSGDEYGPLSLKGWAIFGNCVLTRKAGTSIRMKMTNCPTGKVKVMMHIYDYNKGSNVVEVSLGSVTRSFRCEPAGAAGYRWISEMFDLPQQPAEVVLTAKELGQEFIQIDHLVITKDVRLNELPVSDVSSGFQGLFNVRRMSPQGLWSATWRNPDEDLSVTMTMPAGCAQEVITADGEPEAQPGNPKTIQYVLGRNVTLEEQPGNPGGLFSKYIAVIEPHKGVPAVTTVDKLKAGKASEEAVGLVVRRGQATDLIHSSLTPGEQCRWQGASKPFLVAGEFGLVTVDEEGVQRACLVNGTLLSFGGFVLNASPSPSGRVVSVNHEQNAITLDVAVPNPEIFRDTVVILGNGLHQTSYTIREAKVAAGKTVISLGDVLFTVGMGNIVATDQKTKTVTSATDLAGYGRIDGGRHAGRWLYNEDKSKGFRIAAIAGNKFILEGVEGDLDALYKDTNGDGRRQFWISDIGPGDTFRIPATTYVQRVRRGKYDLRSMTPAKLKMAAVR